MLKGSEVLILYKHADLDPTAESRSAAANLSDLTDHQWSADHQLVTAGLDGTCSEMPVPRAPPEWGISALKSEAPGRMQGCEEWVPAHKLRGADASGNQQKERLGFGGFPPGKATRFK